MSRPRILIAACTESLGHAGRTFELARRLADAGLRIRVAGGGEWDSLFPWEAFAAPQVPYGWLWQWLDHYLPGLPFFAPDQRRVPRHNRFEPHWLDLMGMTEEWVEILKQEAPDLIIADARPELYWAAALLRIPLFGIVSFVWTDLFLARYGREEAFSETDSSPTLLEAFNDVGCRLGLESVKNPWAPFCGTACLVPDARLFTGPRLPTGYFVLGPLVWRGIENGRATEERESWRATVYVTTGTSEFPRFREVARELAASSLRVLYSGGVRSGRNPVVSGAAWARIADAVLCHGGSGSLYQAAVSGAFAFVLPQHFEHQRNGAMFAAHHLARLLPADTPAAVIAGEIRGFCEINARRPRPPRLEEESFDVGRLLDFFEQHAARKFADR